MQEKRTIEVKSSKLKLFITFTLLLFLSSFVFGSFHGSLRAFTDQDQNPILKNSSTISLDETTLSVQYGTNVQQYCPTTFSGIFTDILNDEREWTNDCTLETRLIADSDVWDNDSFTPNNTPDFSPENDSFTMAKGNYVDTGTLDELDDDYASFNSTGGGGNYNGTYTFTGEVGMTGTNISFIDYSSHSGICDVVEEVDGHRDVLKIENDVGISENKYVQNNMSNEADGAVEFWFRTEDNTMENYLYLQNESDIVISFYVNAGTFNVWTTSKQVLTTCNNDEWYHVRIDFDSEDDKYYVYINNIKYGAYDYYLSGDFDYINNVYLGMYLTQDITYYFDAFGYSWDSNYALGDDWYYNSYYGTYNFEQNETQVFDYGYASYSWDNYSMSTDVYYASYDYENITTTVGDYYGTWSFEGETGETGYDIDYLSWLSSGLSASVASSIGGHNEVLQIDSTSAGWSISQEFDSYEASGTIEFWIRTTADVTSYYALREDGNMKIICGYSAGYNGFFYYNGGSAIDPSKPMSLDTWYRIKIVFYSDNTFDAYLNGDVVVTGASNYASFTTGLNYFGVWNGGTLTNYIDAIGYSWDTTSNEGYGYQVGLNFDSANPLDLLKSNINVYPEYSCNVYALDLGDSHSNVLRIDDFSTTQRSWYQHTFYQTSGTIETWFRTTDSTKITYLVIGEGGYTCTTIYTTGGNFDVWDGAPTILTGCTSNVWYHIRIDFDCSTHQSTIYINGIDEGTYSFTNSRDHINVFDFYTYDSHSSYASYLDAFSYTWDNYSPYGYETGWNINPFDITDLLQDGFDVDYQYGTTISLYSTLIDHSDVLRLYDYSSTKAISFEDYFENKGYGTIEFFFLMDDVTKALYFRIQSSGTDIAYFYDGGTSELKVSYGGGIDTVQALASNLWYHFRIDFECTSGGYMSLGQYEFRFFLNGLNRGTYTFKSNVAFIDSFQFNTGGTPSTYNVYLEDYSYSWDSNYEIGDNGYGSGDVDSSLFFQKLDNNCNISLSGEDNAHKKVLKFWDDSTSVYPSMVDRFEEQSSGTIEFYYKKIGTTYTYIRLYEDNSEKIYIHLDDYFAYYDTSEHNLESFVSDSWYYIRIDFDCSTDTFDLTINDNVYSGLNFRNAGDNINQVWFYCHTTGTTEFYLDSLSHSWDSGYEIGDILHSDQSFELEFTTYIDVVDASVVSKYIDLNAYYVTNDVATVNFSVYDYSTSQWYLINSSVNYNDFYPSNYYIDVSDAGKYISSSTQIMMFKFYVISWNGEFDLYLDCFNASFLNKLEISVEKEFNLLGLWKYRFNIPEDSYSSDWYYFNVIEHADNFMAISESPYTTKWTLIGNDTEISTSVRFSDVIDGSVTWDLYDENNNPTMETFKVTGTCLEDSFVNAYYPGTNYGSLTYIIEQSYTIAFFGFSHEDYEYLEVPNYNVLFYVYSNVNNGGNLYSTGSFDEATITWNNMPSPSLIKSENIYTGWTEIDTELQTLDEVYFAHSFVYGDQSFWRIVTKEAGVYAPYAIYSLYKFDQQDGFFVVQGNETETLKAKSSVFTDVSLNAGDFFTILCESNMENMELNLFNDGSIVDTITILTDNVDTSNQTIEVSVDNDVVFDQLQFVGLSRDKDYFKCYGVRADGYDASTQEQMTTFYVAPEESYSTYLDVGYYEMKVYDNDVLRLNKTIEITHEIDDCIQTYTPYYSISCRLTLVNQENELLDISLFEIYITRTLATIMSRISLLDVNFKADLDTTVKFEIYDRFSTHIKNETVGVDNFIFMEIEMYSLKIKNNALNQSDVTITKGTTQISDVLTPDELKEYLLISDDYIVSWYNHENGQETTYNITLDEDKVLTLPTSYNDVYFALFNYDGLGLNRDLFRFYINGLRKDFGFNLIKQDVNNLKVVDYFNATLCDGNVDLGAYTEYNIFVEVYALILNNKYNRSVRIEIERSGITFEQVIPGGFNLPYRFLPNVEYDLKVYEVENDTLLYEEEILLEKNNQIVNFGFYSTEVPIDPVPLISNIYTLVWIVIIACVSVAIVSFLHYRMKRKVKNVPDNIVVRYNKKDRNNGFYDNRIKL